MRAVGGEATYLQSSALWACYAIFAALMLALGHDLSNAVGKERVAVAISDTLPRRAGLEMCSSTVGNFTCPMAAVRAG